VGHGRRGLLRGADPGRRGRRRGRHDDRVWDRISPTFDGGPAPGAFGSITTQGLEQHGRSLRAGYVEVTALCVYPDGVEEFVEITLKKTEAEWQVAGGFAP